MKTINQAAIEETRAIMKDKFPTMIEYFLEDSAEYINSIENGLATNDAQQIKSPAHTLKSSANQLGAEKMSEIAKEMESISKDILDKNAPDDFSKLSNLFNELKSSFAEAEVELKKFIE